MKFLTIGLLALTSTAIASPGCVTECSDSGFKRCDDGVVVECYEHSDFSSKLVWKDRVDCGAEELCVDTGAGEAFCALTAEPHPACAEGVEAACEGTTQVGCQAGRLTRTFECASCVDGICNGGWGADCATDSECAPGLVCAVADLHGDTKHCTVACSCPKFEACAPCDDPVGVALAEGLYAPGMCDEGFCSFTGGG